MTLKPTSRRGSRPTSSRDGITHGSAGTPAIEDTSTQAQAQAQAHPQPQPQAPGESSGGAPATQNTPRAMTPLVSPPEASVSRDNDSRAPTSRPSGASLSREEEGNEDEDERDEKKAIGKENFQAAAEGDHPGAQAHTRHSTWAESLPGSLSRRRPSSSVHYDVPDDYANLGEVAPVSPVQRPDERGVYHRAESLEQVRTRERELRLRRQNRGSAGQAETGDEEQIRARLAAEKEGEIEADEAADEADGADTQVSRLATEFYTISYLIFFSIMGTLARLGLAALTTYPGAPVTFPSLWPNFAGSLVMGFLAEDRKLFRDEYWGAPSSKLAIGQASATASANANEPSTLPPPDLAAAKKAYSAVKKTIPLYIGLATGFCGSFTSFSALIRDAFLALSNDLPDPGAGSTAAAAITPRSGGYSFLALVAVVLVTVSSSLAGLFLGAHLAVALEPAVPSLPFPATRRYADRLAILLGWGCWLGAALLSALPPDRGGGAGEEEDDDDERWRGAATFALVFAPLGTLARFYASLHLNARLPSFPLGTFAVNVAGVVVLGVMWDLAHIPVGGALACQLLQGVEDGFCGCLTTVSTWVAELASLRPRHAYFYGACSVLLSLALVVVVMGSVEWGGGFSELKCYH